ncbi:MULTISPECIES: hypothetical protein [Kocuria]|jgi:hypothetical protein|uniref:hypothetical protein n=1 Tax=Kocuria TaxID=57493 RepID=UPI00203FF2B6|nr:MULTISPECIES: hypothetical protein [Kocuria]MCM3686429.1 hypothetical protein [Kocuria rosea]HST71450.1 hypothetical protein [Kocuria rosea]
MADAVRQVPEKYGPVREAFHPRLGSYGPRLLSCTLPLLVAAAGLLTLFWRRPAAGTAAVVAALVLAAAAVCWTRLRPALVARTDSHLLRSRTVGFAAAPLADVDHVVTVGALHRSADSPRRAGRPHLWAADPAGRAVLALDGTVWDARTLEEVARSLGRPRTHLDSATVRDAVRRWPRLVPWRLRHPRLRSAAASAALVAVVALVLWSALAQQTGA